LDLLERRTATVTAATQCNCMMFRREIVIPVLAKYPDARMLLLEHARRRLVSLNEVADDRGSMVKAGDSNPAQRMPGCAVGFGAAVNGADARLFAANQMFRDVHVDMLHDLSCQMETKQYDEGHTIIEEGQPYNHDKDYVYWISKGTVEVWKLGHFVTLLSEGDVVGDLAAFKAGTKTRLNTRSASVITKSKCTLRAIKGFALMHILDSYGDEELMATWRDLMDSKAEQLEHKKQIYTQVHQMGNPLDFMFMKLPQVGQRGARVPRIEALQETLGETCAPVSAREAASSRLPATAR